MRIFAVPLLLVMMGLSAQAAAVEPVNEVHAMVYFRVSLGAARADADKHSFGFRMDRTSYEPGQMIEYGRLLDRPAALDLRVNSRGVTSFKVSGVDYMQKYRRYRASETATDDAAMEDEPGGSEMQDDAMEEEAVMEEEMVSDEAVDAEKKPGVVEKVITDTGEMMDTVFLDAPKGILIGVGIAIALAAGIGG